MLTVLNVVHYRIVRLDATRYYLENMHICDYDAYVCVYTLNLWNYQHVRDQQGGANRKDWDTARRYRLRGSPKKGVLNRAKRSTEVREGLITRWI